MANLIPPDEDKYPVTLYRGAETRVVHDRDEFNAAMADNFGAYSYQEYPKLMYKAGHKPKAIANRREEQQATFGGWSLEPIAEPQGPRDQVGHPPVSAGRFDAFELLDKVAELEVRISVLEAMQADQKKEKGKPGRKPKVVEESEPVEAIQE